MPTRALFGSSFRNFCTRNNRKFRNPKVRLSACPPVRPDRPITLYQQFSRSRGCASRARRDFQAIMLPTTLQTADGLFKINIFLMHAPQFKDDIQLVFPDASWPTNVPPPLLPFSIASLLSRICDLPYETIDQLWETLKDIVWNWAGMMYRN